MSQRKQRLLSDEPYLKSLGLPGKKWGLKTAALHGNRSSEQRLYGASVYSEILPNYKLQKG